MYKEYFLLVNSIAETNKNNLTSGEKKSSLKRLEDLIKAGMFTRQRRAMRVEAHAFGI